MQSGLPFQDGPDATFVVAGHSHVSAMGAPKRYNGPIRLVPIITPNSKGFVVAEPWQPSGRSEAYWNTLVTNSAGRAAILVHQGNQHFGTFLLAELPLFDFVDPAFPADPIYSDATIVPRRMVGELLYSMGQFDKLREMISRLLASECAAVIVSGTPPVREDFVAGFEYLKFATFWRSVAESYGMTLESATLTPPPIMKRLWRLMQDQLAEIARETGAHFVAVPETVLTPEGFLQPQFHGFLRDFTHANDGYGKLMLEHLSRKVLDILGRSGPLENPMQCRREQIVR